MGVHTHRRVAVCVCVCVCVAVGVYMANVLQCVCVSCVHTVHVDVKVYKCSRYFTCIRLLESPGDLACVLSVSSCVFINVHGSSRVLQCLPRPPSVMLNSTRHVPMFLAK